MKSEESEADKILRQKVAAFDAWWSAGGWWRGLTQVADPVVKSIAQYAFVAGASQPAGPHSDPNGWRPIVEAREMQNDDRLFELFTPGDGQTTFRYAYLGGLDWEADWPGDVPVLRNCQATHFRELIPPRGETP